MNRYSVTLDFSCTITIEAEDEEDARSQGEATDITEVFDDVGVNGATVANVELVERNIDGENEDGDENEEE